MNASTSVAKVQLVQAMLQGHSWQEARHVAGIQVSRATAYRLRQRVLSHGEDAVRDGRAGHPFKVCGAVRAWLEAYYQQHPRAPGSVVQALLEEQCSVRVSVTHLNRMRAALTGATRTGGKSVRCVAGRNGWAPQAFRSARDKPAPDLGGCPANAGGASDSSPTGTGHRPHAATLPADPALSGGRRAAPPVGLARVCPTGVGAPHQPAPGLWISNDRAVSLGGRTGGLC